MNIFVIDPDNINTNAKMLDDKRLVKMILETAQLLATAVNLSGGKATYKTTHQNHPCSIWVRENKANFYWLITLFDYLNEEYSFRYGRTHKCYFYRNEFIDQAYLFKDAPNITPHPNCTNFKTESDVYKAYKLCMIDKWKNDKRTPKWSLRNPPEWFISGV